MLTKKKVRKSSYDEILIEAKLVTCGTLVSAFSGKGNSKALFKLKAVAEDLNHYYLKFLLKIIKLKSAQNLC